MSRYHTRGQIKKKTNQPNNVLTQSELSLINNSTDIKLIETKAKSLSDISINSPKIKNKQSIEIAIMVKNESQETDLDN